MKHSLQSITVKLTDTVKTVQEKLNVTGSRFCLVIDNSMKLKGTITDGDIRRKSSGDTQPVSAVMNRNPIVARTSESEFTIRNRMSETVTFIPILDSHNHLIDYMSIFETSKLLVSSPVLKGNESKYIEQCLRENSISSRGMFVTRFERQFVEHTQRPYALATSNGTAALHLAIEAMEIGPGDEVIVPNLTFVSPAAAVIHAGAKPVLVDVDRFSWNISISEIKKALSPRTKAIIPVHLYGQPCDMEPIMQLAKVHNLWVIEDCAEALGSRVSGVPTGSFGHAAIYSFYANKTVTTGEGGMVVFREEKHFERGRLLRDHGMSPEKRYWHDLIGYNYRMTNLQAALGVAQMERLSELLDAKKKNATLYKECLSEINGIEFPPESKDLENSYWLFTVLLSPDFPMSRDALADQLTRSGVEVRPVFSPLHRMPVFKNYRKIGNFPNSIAISEAGLSLPSAADLEESLVRTVSSLIRTASRSAERRRVYRCLGSRRRDRVDGSV